MWPYSSATVGLHTLYQTCGILWICEVDVQFNWGASIHPIRTNVFHAPCRVPERRMTGLSHL